MAGVFMYGGINLTMRRLKPKIEYLPNFLYMQGGIRPIIECLGSCSSGRIYTLGTVQDMHTFFGSCSGFRDGGYLSQLDPFPFWLYRLSSFSIGFSWPEMASSVIVSLSLSTSACETHVKVHAIFLGVKAGYIILTEVFLIHAEGCIK